MKVSRPWRSLDILYHDNIGGVKVLDVRWPGGQGVVTCGRSDGMGGLCLLDEEALDIDAYCHALCRFAKRCVGRHRTVNDSWIAGIWKGRGCRGSASSIRCLLGTACKIQSKCSSDPDLPPMVHNVMFVSLHCRTSAKKAYCYHGNVLQEPRPLLWCRKTRSLSRMHLAVQCAVTRQTECTHQLHLVEPLSGSKIRKVFFVWLHNGKATAIH